MAHLIHIRLALAGSLFAALTLCASAQEATDAPAPAAAPAVTTAASAATISAEGAVSATAAAPAVTNTVEANENAPAAMPPSQRFAEGNASYAAGDYATAAAQFAQVAAEHPSLAAYYNLGNSYFRLGQYGQAIAAYEKARAINPAQPEVLANLDRAREAARIAEPVPTRWEQYARKLSPNGWAVLLAVSFWAALALWLVPAQYRRPHGIWRPSLLALSIAILVLSAVGLYPWRQLSRAGTVLEADAPLLLAPVSTSPVQSYAQAGQPAQLIGSHGQFDRIRLPDGSEGWIARTQFATTWQTRR